MSPSASVYSARHQIVAFLQFVEKKNLKVWRVGTVFWLTSLFQQRSGGAFAFCWLIWHVQDLWWLCFLAHCQISCYQSLLLFKYFNAVPHFLHYILLQFEPRSLNASHKFTQTHQWTQLQQPGKRITKKTIALICWFELFFDVKAKARLRRWVSYLLTVPQPSVKVLFSSLSNSLDGVIVGVLLILISFSARKNELLLVRKI